jgi:hypothetical protein
MFTSISRSNVGLGTIQLDNLDTQVADILKQAKQGALVGQGALQQQSPGRELPGFQAIEPVTPFSG